MARKKDGKLGGNVSRLSFHSLRHGLNLAPRRYVELCAIFEVQDIVKGRRDVAELRGVFERRKSVEAELISSPGEAGKHFITFLDIPGVLGALADDGVQTAFQVSRMN